MKAATFAVPGSLDTPTGGYVYDRRIISELRALGWRIDVLDLGEGFPEPGEVARRAALEMLAGDKGEGPLVVDGLALGVLPEAPPLVGGKRSVVALVHHPLALETGVSPERAEVLRASERAALAGVSHVIVTSDATARLVAAEYGVPAERITVALPGNDRGRRATGGRGGLVNLVSVGTLVPRKGYDVLLAALAPLAEFAWRLDIVGDADRHPPTAAAVRDQIRQLCFGERVHLAGTLDSKALVERYSAADLFVLASRFEGYGMAFSEAIAHGLPIIGTTAGAIPGTVPAGAGVLVPPDDVAALTAALRVAITDVGKRRQWSDAAWAAAQTLPTWESTTKGFAAVLRTAS